jgi:hypothetical protein
VSSRQQEKERRRQERLAAERAAASAASRRKRMTYALAGLAALLLVAVVALLAGGVIGGDDSNGQPASANAVDTVPIPEQQIGDLEAAADAAGCELASPEIEGATHDPDKQFEASDYRTNPPTSGDHAPVWYEDGTYNPGDTPELGMLVHTLEHGRINVQYKPGTPERAVGQLQSVLEEFDGYHMLLYENTTGMDAQVAATTWGQSLTCPRMNDEVFDALRTFTREYVDTGPEQVQ